MASLEEQNHGERPSDETAASNFDEAIGRETVRRAFLEYRSEYALRFCTVIFFGEKRSDHRATMEAAGTGTLLELEDRKLIVTNDHVLAEYEKYRQDRVDTHFQVGRAALDPFELLIARDPKKDLCTLDATGLELQDLNDRLATDPAPPLQFYRATRWPPARVKKGDRLSWAGFPGSLREHKGETVFHGPLSWAAQLTAGGEVHPVMRLRVVAFAPHGARARSPAKCAASSHIRPGRAPFARA